MTAVLTGGSGSTVVMAKVEGKIIMAGMFYSRKEAVEKLNKTDSEIDGLVKQGRLREFRHGETLMYKVDEVDALAGEAVVTEQPEPQPQQAETDLEAEQTPTTEETVSAEETPLIEEAPSVEELSIDEEVPTLEEAPAGEKTSGSDADEISLAPEAESSQEKPEQIELSDADTAIVDEGINVLGETDTKDVFDELKPEDEGGGLSDLGETSVAAADEASLEEIEQDVSLDTFGSGSGLLDLSLQADDTSLGGILDEIYTQEGEGKPAGEEAAAGSAAEMAAEAEQMLGEEEFVEPQPVPASPVVAAAYAESEPDTISNFLGFMMFIPLAAVIYTTMVVVAGSRNIMPRALTLVQGYVWYGVIGLAVLSVLIVGAAFTMSGEKKPKKPKVKKQKPPRPKKEKKPKKKKGKK